MFANDRYAEIYGLTPEQVKPGTTLRQIFEARAASGGFYEAIDARNSFCDGFAALRSNKSRQCRQSWPTGACISVVRRPMPDGGLVSTHEDITEREQLNARLADAATSSSMPP